MIKQSLVIIGDLQGNILFIDLASGTIQRALQNHTGAVNFLHFFAEGSQLISGGEDGILRLWDVDKQELISKTLSVEHIGSLTAIAQRPESSQFITTSTNGALSLWELQDGSLSLRHTLWVDGALTCIDSTPDGKIVAVGGEKGLYMFDIVEP